jgi:hypothetical protein
MGSSEPAEISTATDAALSSADKAVQDAIAEAEHAANPGHGAHAADDVPPPADDMSTGDDAPEAPPAQ